MQNHVLKKINVLCCILQARAQTHRKNYRVCHGFRLTKLDDNFQVNFDQF